MAQSPWVTLAAGVAGATVGLLAPVIAAWLSRRGSSRQTQHRIAVEIVELLTGPGSLDTMLGGPESPVRRRLYGLAALLSDKKASEACRGLIGEAGTPGVAEGDLYGSWNHAINEVGRVARGNG